MDFKCHNLKIIPVYSTNPYTAIMKREFGADVLVFLMAEP